MHIALCRKLSLARNVKCDACQGKGTKSGRQYTCEVQTTSTLQPEDYLPSIL